MAIPKRSGHVFSPLPPSRAASGTHLAASALRTALRRRDRAALLVPRRVRADLALEPGAAEGLHAARRDARELVLRRRKRSQINPELRVGAHSSKSPAAPRTETGASYCINRAPRPARRGAGPATAWMPANRTY
jgi:hypothetical protein